MSTIRSARIDAGRALFVRRKRFDRKTISANAKRGVVFVLDAVGRSLLDRSRHIRGELYLGSKFGPLARFRVAFRRTGGSTSGALLGFLGLGRDRGGAQLALKIGRALFDSIEFAAVFIVQAVQDGQLGHSAALFRLPVAKIAQPLLSFGHWEIPYCELRESFPRKKDIEKKLADAMFPSQDSSATSARHAISAVCRLAPVPESEGAAK